MNHYISYNLNARRYSHLLAMTVLKYTVREMRQLIFITKYTICFQHGFVMLFPSEFELSRYHFILTLCSSSLQC